MLAIYAQLLLFLPVVGDAACPTTFIVRTIIFSLYIFHCKGKQNQLSIVKTNYHENQTDKYSHQAFHVSLLIETITSLVEMNIF
jgi:hypothetical protein